MNIAIILAGGVGSRVGANKPKQFIEILGKPILAYTIEAFQKHNEIDAIEIVCVESHIDYLKEIIEKYGYNKVKWITKGGKDFQHSVINGVKNLDNKINENDIVLVHFGASPFVTREIISDAIKVCKVKGNAISTTPFYLLCGEMTDKEKSLKYIDRETVACMNSPHAFNYKLIKDMYEKAEKENIIDTVEPHTTTLMYKMNIPIYFSKGSQTNIKITTKEDLELFEGYAMLKEHKN